MKDLKAAKALLDKDHMNLTTREYWVFSLLESLIGEGQLSTTFDADDLEDKLIDQAVRLANKLAIRLTEK